MTVILLAYERDQDLAAIETLLEARGHRVLKSRTGLEALEVARHDPPHAVVSDVLLPLLDGFALCRRLREDPATRHLPVFLLSFRVEGPKYEAFAAEVGAQRFFPRGSTLEDLVAAIDSVKAGTDTMRIPALVPELLDRQEQDRRKVAELERQIRDLQHANKLLGAAERSARGKLEQYERDKADVAATSSDKAREQQQRIDELEAQLREASDTGADMAGDLQRRIAELERQLRDATDTGAEQERKLQQRVKELEARQQELSAAESQARAAAAEETRAGLARLGVLEARLAELQSRRAKAQAAAADAERALGAQPLPTVLSDMETSEIRAVSDSAAALLATAPEELIGRRLAEALPGCAADEAGALPAELELSLADGTRSTFQLRRNSVSYAGRACWLTTLVDVSAERVANAARQQSDALVAALEAAPAPVCIVREDGRLHFANARFRELVSLASGRADDLNLQQFEVQSEDDGAGSADVPIAGGGTVRRAQWRRADGSVFDAEISTSAANETSGERVVTVRDVTALRLAEHRVADVRRRDAGLLDLAQHAHTLTELEVPSRALELARQVTGSAAGYVFMLTPDGSQMELAARADSGAEAGQTLPVRWRGPAPTGTALGECAQTLQAVERDIAESTGSLRQAGLPGRLERQLATPVLDGGRLVGVLLLANKATRFDDDDRASAALVADGLWKALRRRRSDAEIVSAMDHMERVMLGAIEAIGALSEAQDACKVGRARRVGELAASIGTAMGLPGHSVRGLRVIGQLIDVGMLQIPREILWRPSPLTAAEFELVRTHADRGHETLRRIDFPWPVAEAVRQHHERLDGSGYPRGLKGEEILIEARIVAVADAVEAMLSPRPQRQALSMTACIDELQAQAGRRYDAAVVRACVRLLRERHAQAAPEARAGQRIA